MKMESQLYRNEEHHGLGILEVLYAVPIEPGLQRVQREFIPSNFGPSTPPGYPQVTYDDLLLKGSGFYNVFVRDERGLEFTMRNAFWDSFVPVSEESPVSKEKPLMKYGTWVDKATSASTKEYFGMLRDIFQKRGIGTALSLDLDTTIERLMNFCNILGNNDKIVRSEK